MADFDKLKNQVSELETQKKKLQSDSERLQQMLNEITSTFVSRAVFFLVVVLKCISVTEISEFQSGKNRSIFLIRANVRKNQTKFKISGKIDFAHTFNLEYLWGTVVYFVWLNIVLFWRKMQITERR